jgi:electron transport complex protein RnfB
MPELQNHCNLAVIAEDACIGCGKCLMACPIDAIIGAPRYMHTVISEECTGCALCIAPCPVDCITLVASPLQDKDWRLQRAMKTKKRVVAKTQRKTPEYYSKRPGARVLDRIDSKFELQTIDKKSEIHDLLNRIKMKKNADHL